MVSIGRRAEKATEGSWFTNRFVNDGRAKWEVRVEDLERYGEVEFNPPAVELVPIRYSAVVMPLWMSVALFSIAPMALVGPRIVKGVRRRRRMKLGLCLGCGYDVRGMTDRCPECGEPLLS